MAEATLGLAHDFANQLQTILGFSEVGLGELDAGRSPAESLRVIRDVSTQATDVIRSLLDVRRGTLARMRPIDCRDVLLSAAASAALVQHRGMHIDLELPQAPLRVNGDFVLLREAICNLLRNAVQASALGGTVRIGGAVHPRSDSDWIALTVSDDGAGIPADRLADVFEPFVTTRRCETALGLGLVAVRSTALLHRGRIEVSSTPGVGSTFTLQLPAVAAIGEHLSGTTVITADPSC